MDEGTNLTVVDNADDTLEAKLTRIEDKLDTLIGIFSDMGEQIGSLMNGGGMGSLIKGLMGRE